MIATVTGWGASFAPISGAPPQIAALVYPGMVLLDLLGPHTVFNLLRAEVHLVAKDRVPVSTDVGYLVTPTAAKEAAIRAGARLTPQPAVT
jgi:putative intracellular protease/amidase